MSRNIEQYVKNYESEEHNFEKYQVYYRRKKVLNIIENYHPNNILEIGCGNEPIFDYFGEFDKFTTIEPAKEFYETALQKADNNSNIEIINDYIHNKVEYLKNKNFDFIICSSLLHELDNPQELMEDIRSLCGKNTIVHINVPNSKSFHLLWGYKAGLITDVGVQTETAKKLQQNSVFDLDSLIELVKNAGFSVRDKGSYFIKPFNHKKMSECLKWDILDEKLLDGLYYLTEFFPESGSEIYVNCEVK